MYVSFFLSLYLYRTLSENRSIVFGIVPQFFSVVPQCFHSKSKFHSAKILNYTKLQLTLLNYSLLQNCFVRVTSTACYKTVKRRSNVFGRTSLFLLCTYLNKNNIQSMQLHLELFHIRYLTNKTKVRQIFLLFSTSKLNVQKSFLVIFSLQQRCCRLTFTITFYNTKPSIVSGDRQLGSTHLRGGFF